MFRWKQIVKELISIYISSLINVIVKEGFKPPGWDPQKIAENVTSKLLSELSQNNQDDKNNWSELMLRAFQLASREMANALDWEIIRKELIAWIKKNKPLWISIDESEDIAGEAITITLKKWEPFREVNWSQPGLEYAKGVARKLFWKRDPSLTPLDEVNITGPGVKFGKPDPAKLAKTIDDWLFDNCPHKLAATFVLDIVYAVNWEVCGMMASKEKRDTRKAYSAFWYRKRENILNELRKYLYKNEHLYCT